LTTSPPDPLSWKERGEKNSEILFSLSFSQRDSFGAGEGAGGLGLDIQTTPQSISFGNRFLPPSLKKEGAE